MKTPTPALSTQLIHAARAVQAVRQGRSLTEVLSQFPASVRPATQALSFTVLRRLGSAEAARSCLVTKAPSPEVDALLLTALALLWPDQASQADAPYADHTLVNQTVAAVKQEHPHSASFVNAVLRRFIRERDDLLSQLNHQPVFQTNHPAWWIKQLQQDWPEHWSHILEANNQHAPMCLRVNARWGTAQDYLDRLSQAGLTGHLVEHPLLRHAVQLEHPVSVNLLPDFAQGAVSVQDAAAQLAAPLLLQSEGLGQASLAPGARVLDACAAPGGKTAHLLELAALDLVALDSDASRLQRVTETLSRLQLNAHTLAADAGHTARWWDGQTFDAILLDAPCSASGIVRRHPDIRWLRRPDDLAQFQRSQMRLLRELWPLLKPQGRLLFATCSVFRCEGPEVMEAFQREHANARLVTPIHGSLLPGLPPDNPMCSPGDGFFYALLEKQTD